MKRPLELGRVALLFTALSFGCSKKFEAAPVLWKGHALCEVTSLRGLPHPILAAIGAGISDHGGPFNPTDVVRLGVPSRRFLTAGHADGVWLVAIERGGRSDFTAVMVFDSSQADPVETWCIDRRARSLGGVVEQLRTGHAVPLDRRLLRL